MCKTTETGILTNVCRQTKSKHYGDRFKELEVGTFELRHFDIGDSSAFSKVEPSIVASKRKNQLRFQSLKLESLTDC
jgi:hypothetical protein